MTKLRLACVGAGPDKHSRSRGYLAVVKALHDLYELCAVVDPNESNGREAAAEYGIPGVYTDMEKAIEETRPDVVLRLAPTDSAMAICVTAAQMGCNVISEIPIDITLPRADATIKACRENNVRIEIAENVWLWPEEQLKQEIVRRGIIGRPVHARLKYPCGSYHGFNGVRMILAEEAVRVLGFGGTVEVMPLPAYAGGMMTQVQWDGSCVEFSSGLKLLFEMPPKKPVWERNWDIIGTHGYLTGDSLVLYREGHHHGSGEEERFPIESVYREIQGQRVLQAVRVNTDPVVEWVNPYIRYGISGTDDIAKAAILESMYRAVVDGQPLRYGAENARRDQELVIATKESAWRGSEWVSLPLSGITRVEQRIHEVFREMYGCDPLGDVGTQLRARYSRLSAQWTVAGWL